MKKSIVDQVWHKIGERDLQGRVAADSKLNEFVELARRISQAEGGDVADNVLDHGLIEVALLRCREIQDGKAGLDYNDLHIYFRYATAAMLKAEAAIDEELPHLEL